MLVEFKEINSNYKKINIIYETVMDPQTPIFFEREIVDMISLGAKTCQMIKSAKKELSKEKAIQKYSNMNLNIENKILELNKMAFY